MNISDSYPGAVGETYQVTTSSANIPTTPAWDVLTALHNLVGTNEISSENLKQLSAALRTNGAKNDENEFQSLKPLLEGIAKELVDDPQKFNQDQREIIIGACRGLKILYSHHYPDNSPAGMIKRNDILEALSVAYRKDNSINDLLKLELNQRITRISMAELKNIKQTFSLFQTIVNFFKIILFIDYFFKNTQTNFKKYDILLINYADLPKATALIEEQTALIGQELTAEEMHLLLSQHNIVLMKEGGPIDREIDLLYAHSHLIDKGLNYLNQQITKYREKLKDKNVTPLQIAAFFKTLHITLESNLQGQLYAYGETFVTDFRAEESRDLAFQRKLTPLAEEILLKEAQEFQTQIDDTVGSGAVIISNSFNRLSNYHVKAGEAGKRFELVGKLLEDSEQNAAAAAKETVHSTKFGFSVSSLLGCKPEVINKSFKTVITAQDLDEIKKNDPAKAHRMADRLTLESMARVANKEDWEMFVQRLAPEDIHHYAASINGTVLNRQESVKTLQQMLTTADVSEKEQLSALLEFYQNDPSKKDSSYISVQGGVGSVSRNALKHRAEVLATNDRHIMMVRDQEGGVSFHAFIGATAVDNVAVTARVGDATMGTDFGSMGASKSKEFVGPEGVSAKDDASVLRAQKEREVESIKVIQTSGIQKIGADIGGFTLGGSTVVSLFPSKKFQPSSQIATAAEVLRHRVENNSIQNSFRKLFGMDLLPPESRSIEIKAELGQVIGQPMSLLSFNVMRKIIDPEIFDKIIFDGLASGQTTEYISSSLKSNFNSKMNVLENNKQANMTKQEFDLAKKLNNDLQANVKSSLIATVDQAVNFNIQYGAILGVFKEVIGIQEFQRLRTGANAKEEIIKAFLAASSSENFLSPVRKELTQSMIKALQEDNSKQTTLLQSIDNALYKV